MKTMWWWFPLASCACILAGCGVSSGAASVSVSHDANSAGALGSSTTVLVPSRRSLDFGIVPQGGEHREYFELRNPTDSTVEVSRIDLSCDCLAITLVHRRVPQGGKVMACADLDLRGAPHFLGGLEIDAKGLTALDQTAFVLTIRVDVRPSSAFDGLQIESPVEATGPPTPVPVPLRGVDGN